VVVGATRSLMFVPGRAVMESGSANFVTPREAMASPLAKKLFTIEGVAAAPNEWTVRLTPPQDTALTGMQHMQRASLHREQPMRCLSMAPVGAGKATNAHSGTPLWLPAPFPRSETGRAMGAGVNGVFFGSDFVTVSKGEDDAWSVSALPCSVTCSSFPGNSAVCVQP
jgi:hypothetical protein